MLQLVIVHAEMNALISMEIFAQRVGNVACILSDPRRERSTRKYVKKSRSSLKH